MPGQDTQEAGLFSYLSPEERVPPTHPLRSLRHAVDTALVAVSSQLEMAMPGPVGIRLPQEKLLRALLFQAHYSLRS